jgi:hypothetical protein
MWRINDDDLLGEFGHTIAEVNAVGLGWPARRKSVAPPDESEIWLAPAREGELEGSAQLKATGEVDGSSPL